MEEEKNAALNLYNSQLDTLAKWLSCNGEVWGVGPTALFASAAVLFLYNELEATVFMPGDQVQVSILEKTLISTMMFGMLALMIHLWVCSMRFFQYYLDTVIRDSPTMLLEMTTVGLLGGQSEMMPLGPLTRFLRQQQPQIHITVCWFLSLCYADYVRKHYCQRFNLPYLEQWQAELQERVVLVVHQVMEKVNNVVVLIHQRLRGYAQTDSQIRAENIDDINTVREPLLRDQRSAAAKLVAGSCGPKSQSATPPHRAPSNRQSNLSVSTASQAGPQKMVPMELQMWRNAQLAVHSTSATTTLSRRESRSVKECPMQWISQISFD